MPTQSRNERTRAGCWTCRARRKKCDGLRPKCMNCSNLSLDCEGYELRVKWTNNRTPSFKPGSGQRSVLKLAEPTPKKTVLDVSILHSPPDIWTQRRNLSYFHLGQEYWARLDGKDKEIMHDCGSRDSKFLFGL